MIRAAYHKDILGKPVTDQSEPAAGRDDRGSAPMTAMLERMSGAASAGLLCAWAGRSGRRLVFSVIELDPDRRAVDMPLGPGVLVLAVQRPATGPRRILWAASVETEAVASAVSDAASALAATGGGELHCHVSADPAGVSGLVTDFERLWPAVPESVRVPPTQAAHR